MVTRSPTVVQLPQWRTARKNVSPNLPLAPHPLRRMTADPSQERSVQPHAQSRVQDLAHGLDQLLRSSGIGKAGVCVIVELDPFAVHIDMCCHTGLCFMTFLLQACTCLKRVLDAVLLDAPLMEIFLEFNFVSNHLSSRITHRLPNY